MGIPALLLAALAAAVLASSAAAHGYAAPQRRSNGFSWNDIEPSEELRWHDCYKSAWCGSAANVDTDSCPQSIQCARLQLPLDWNATEEDATYGEKYNMALLKIPARVNVTDPRYGGPILVNPGGPGDSGTRYILRRGPSLQRVLDAAYAYNSNEYLSPHPDAKYFDIVGFDPRSVDNSTPAFDCGNVEETVRLPENCTDGLYLTLHWPKGNLDCLWAYNIAASRACVNNQLVRQNGSLIANFSSTAMVARDLVEFVERHGEWRENVARTTSQTQRLQWRRHEEPVMFYGLSYGTLLGSTLAAMQPHRVSRFLLDGVMSAEQYYAGKLTLNAIDVDRMYRKFDEYCTLAGPKRCPKDDSSPAGIEKWLRRISDGLGKNRTWGAGKPGMIQGYIESMLSSPLTSWEAFASSWASQSSQNATPSATQKQHRTPGSLRSAGNYSTISPDTYYYTRDVVVGCDTALRMTKQQFENEVWSVFHNQGPESGDYLATDYMKLYTWPVTAKWRFGDIHPIASNVTAHGILFVSNLLDGTTSFDGALEGHKAFKGSGLLMSEGEGHIAVSEPSLCLAKAMREYFQTGAMPAFGVHCKPYKRPFLGNDTDSDTEHLDWPSLTKEEVKLWEAMLDF